MGRLRALALVLAVVTTVSVALGAAGFSSVAAERAVDVAVVETDEAYVGVVACEVANEQGNGPGGSGNGSGENPVHVWVTNRFAQSFVVDEIVADGGDDRLDPDEQIGVGQRERFESLNAHDSVTVVVDGPTISATVTVDVTPETECPLSPADDSDGDGSTATATPSATATPTDTATATSTPEDTETPTDS